ncbi:carbohydrate ABC transporter permease [Paenibacillus sp. J2TS4]|uniref:carbohydrate ABC transporter permease n=1 Tax=Paenibacillus sp. J2TS4 TaxID=2807194 RepID=UPI001B08C189|nr:carbohydrate ABC transporter permease [Paenibacillus sp. J2TS4]GIP34081.1 putative ABC transporter permease protein YtcP [Paenibacillus sp. J2TS4]
MNLHKSEKSFQFTNGVFMILLCLSMIAPMIHLLAISLSNPIYAEARLVYLWPKGFNLEVYKNLFQMNDMWRAMGVSVFITVMGTLLCLVLTSTLAFTLTRPQMPGRKWILRLILFTFIFPVPLIPSFLVVKSLGMMDTLWALIVPGALGAYFIFITKTFFQGISSELIDAAKIDGSGELGILTRIILPLSTPVLATIALFHAVGQWNAYFGALIYIRSVHLYPLQLKLRNMVQNSVADSGLDGGYQLDTSMMQTPEMMKAGAIIFSTIPILLVYPFLQKYFVKGAFLGSLKE